MKRLLLPVLISALLMLACTLTPAPTAAPPTPRPAVTEPPVVTEEPVTSNVSCYELALYLDPSLAAEYECQSVPESLSEVDRYPTHTELTLWGYPLTDKFFVPHISVYPVAAYTTLQPGVVSYTVTDLQALVASGTVPLFTSSIGLGLPFLPPVNAAQLFYAQADVLPFASGSGIRYLAEYAQYTAAVNNRDLFYTYQGLTGDGQYWVSVILPITHPMLPDNSENPPGGLTWEEFSDNYGGYITDMVKQLNSQPDESYFPTLSLMDALVTSITITP